MLIALIAVAAIFGGLHVHFRPGKGPKSLQLLGLLLPFRKMPKAFLYTQRTVRKLRIHIRDHIPERSTVLDF